MRASIITLCMLIPLLTACSREPNEQELRHAYERNLAETNAITNRMGSSKMHMSLQEFKKVSCTKADSKNSYQCKIEVVLNTPLLGVQKQQGEIKANKQGNDWIITYD